MTNTLNDLQMYMYMYLWLIDWIGTFSNDDNNGSENVAKKMNLHSFKLNSIYLDPLKCQMQVTFPGVELLRILLKFKKRKENSSLKSTSSIKRQIRKFRVVVVQWMSKTCTKKHDVRAQLLFWSLNLLFFEVVVVVIVA